MRHIIVLLPLLALAQEKKSDRIVKSLNDDATFQCSSSASQDQIIKVIFTSVVNKKPLNVLILSKQNGVVMTQFQKEQRINGNAGTVTVQGVQLEDEGDYECNILHLSDGREETTTHELVVRIKPVVEEIEDLATATRPIIDYNDNKLVNGPNVVDVAKCIVKDAKPKATVRWEFESSQLKMEDEATEDFPDNNNQKYSTTSTLRIIPQSYYNNQIVKCIVNHVELGKPVVKTFKLNVHFAPKTPVLKPNLAQQKLTCESNANPEPSYGWVMPDGSNVLTERTIDLMPEYMGNPNATYRCTVDNDYGTSFAQISMQEIQTYTDEDETTIASIPILAIIGLAVIIFIIIVGVLVYKYFLNPRQSDKSYSDGPHYPYGTTSKSDHIVTDLHSSHPVPNYDHDSADEDNAPILSPNSAQYHAARRQGDQLRHSPSRTQGNYYGGQQDYEHNYDEADEGDDMIDSVQDRWTDYHPGHPQQQQQQHPKGQNWVTTRDQANFHSEMV